MRCVALAFAMTLFTGYAIAEEATTRLPAMVELPIVITAVGETISARVKNWGSLGDTDSSFTTLKNRVVADLEKRDCSFTFSVEPSKNPGVFVLRGSEGQLSCVNSDASTNIIRIKGMLVTASKVEGLPSPTVDQQAFFVPLVNSEI